MASKVIKVVKDLTGDFLTDTDMELVDVEFVKEGPHRYLRIIVDKEDGITIDDCKKISDFLNKELDSRNLVKERYYLEVTSPGIERELKTEEEYTKFEGEMVTIKLYHPVNSLKKYVGVLKGHSKAYVTVEVDGEDVQIPRNKIAQIKLYYEF